MQVVVVWPNCVPRLLSKQGTGNERVCKSRVCLLLSCESVSAAGPSSWAGLVFALLDHSMPRHGTAWHGFGVAQRQLD